MTPKSDETAPSGTLPEPELNPLLNPILNKNLGRWAEVYFTNPPERRDEAVLNLLHQLEREPEKEASAPDKARRRSGEGRSETRAETRAEARWIQGRNDQGRDETTGSAAISSRAPRVEVCCPDCGFENEAQQRFCGECGAPLGMAPASNATSILALPREPQGAKASETVERTGASQDIEPMQPTQPTQQFGSILHLQDAPLDLQSANKRIDADLARALSREDSEPSALKGSYRILIGTVLALVIAVLVYQAWRSGRSSIEGSTLPAQVPLAVSQSASAPAVSAPQQNANSALPPGSTSTAAAPSTSAPGTAAEGQSAEGKPDEGQSDAASIGTPRSVVRPVAETKPEVVLPDSASVSGNGNQELATALSFLNSQPRDTAAAAQWLWKAVEKRNTQAIVLLAGLYLRGDGVQKNCDQGRILLDAAADKGNKDAANLLRNLQAFGCQ